MSNDPKVLGNLYAKLNQLNNQLDTEVDESTKSTVMDDIRDVESEISNIDSHNLVALTMSDMKRLSAKQKLQLLYKIFDAQYDVSEEDGVNEEKYLETLGVDFMNRKILSQQNVEGGFEIPKYFKNVKNLTVNFCALHEGDADAYKIYESSSDLIESIRNEDMKDISIGEIRSAIQQNYEPDVLISCGLPITASIDEISCELQAMALSDYIELENVEKTFMNGDTDRRNYDTQILILDGKKIF